MLSAANTDYIQATIEIFGAVITLVLGIMLYVITGNKRKSEKNLFGLILLAGISLLVDAGWYIFDGSSSAVGIVINFVCNFAIFIINPLLLSFLYGYLSCLIEEDRGKVPKFIHWCVYGLAGLGAAIVVSNLFYNWMYTIDEMNIYHRLDGWAIYAIVNCLAIVLIILMVLINIKVIPGRQRVALLIFLLAPFIGIALQSNLIGVSFIQIGIVVGCVAILINYVIEMISKENSINGLSNERRNFLLIECILLIMILCISASIISCIISINLVANENSEQNSTALTYMVSDAVNTHLSEPVNASRTMAKSQIVMDALTEENLQGTDTEEKLIAYMNRIKNEYGFQTVFVASESTYAYYTEDGFSRYMDASRDSEDSWYGRFRNRYIEYALNVDADKDNGMSLCIFVNVAVYDDDNNFIGVCGVALPVDDFIDLLSEYESEYNLDISLINSDGLIQIDTDRSKIEQDFIDIPKLQPGSSYEIYYERNSIQAVMSKYIEDLNWYLVVGDNAPDKLNVFQIILPSLIIFALGIVLLLVFIIMYNNHNKKNLDDLRASRRLSETDGLTGLFNRYALEEYTEEVEKNGLPPKITVCMVDINGLKFVNDNLGHEAGDELIKGAADCMTKAIMSEGMIYRFGGDEFVIIMECAQEKAEGVLDNFKKLTESWHGKLVKELSVSIGVVSNETYPDMDLIELKNEADKLMYQDKNLYYERTGKARRSE